MCTPPLLHTDAFTHRRFYSQTVSHTDHFTHTRLYTQTHLHTHTHAHMRPFTPGPRKLEQMHCHTKKLSHPDPVTYRPCCTVDTVRRPGSEMSTLVNFQLIGSLQERKLARKKITESDDCLSSSWILPAQKDDATFLFCSDGRATKPSGFHKKRGTHWLTASITLKPCVDRAAGRLKLTTKCCWSPCRTITRSKTGYGSWGFEPSRVPKLNVTLKHCSRKKS